MTWYYNQEDTQPKQYKMYNQKRSVFQKYTKNLAPNMRQTQQYQEKIIIYNLCQLVFL